MSLYRKRFVSSILSLATGFSLVAFPVNVKAETIMPPAPLSIHKPDGSSQIFAELEKTKKGSILKITGNGLMGDNLYLPSKRWFNGFEKNITEIKIGKGVNSIGEYAFGGDPNNEEATVPLSKLKKVTIPSTVEKIKRGAFYGASSLPFIYIPGSVKEIGAHSFHSAETLSEVVLDKGIESIGNGTFLDCKNLQYITIPEGVTSIESQTFDKSLTFIVLPKTLEKIKEQAFQSSLNALIYSPNVLIDKGAFPEGSVIRCYKGSITEKSAKEHGGLTIEHISANEVTSPGSPLVTVQGKKLKIQVAAVPNAKSYKIVVSKDKNMKKKAVTLKKKKGTTKKLKKGTYYVYAFAINGKNQRVSKPTVIKIK